MDSKTYADLLVDPRWQTKRIEILDRDNNSCRFCGSQNNLNIHHIIYRKNSLPWQYENNELLTLCKDCHNDVTVEIEKSIELVRQISCFPDAAEQLNYLLSQLIGLNPFQIRAAGKIIRRTIQKCRPEVDLEKFTPGIR